MTYLIVAIILIGVGVQIYRANQDPVEREYKGERVLYVVEPLVDICVAWEKREDIPDNKKTTTIIFSDIDDVQLKARNVKVGDETYWKLYLIGEKGMKRVYVPAGKLNPVEQIIK